MKGARLRVLGGAALALAVTASLAGCERLSGPSASLSTLAPVMARADGDPAGFEVDQLPHPVARPLSQGQSVAADEGRATLVAIAAWRPPQRSQ